VPSRPKVFYNPLCPVCRASFADQRRRMDAAGEPVEWCDINEHPDALTEIGADIEAVRLRLHVREADGSLAIGSVAFVALWRRTPGQRGLSRFLGLPGNRTFAAFLYDTFA